MSVFRSGLLNRMTDKKRDQLARFQREEGGSMVVFTLFLLTLMLVVGGMAVDFMRFESRRSLMQGALDGAVLAAADLDQSLTPAAVVQDHLAKSEVGDCLTAPAAVTPGTNYRKVEAVCSIELDTFFLRLVGINTLDAYAKSVAIEGVGNIEVSLVLDISGSMDDDIPNTSIRKIDRLETAGLAFVAALLKPDYADKVSLSLVPYSQDVNIGKDLFDTLKTNQNHGYSYCVDLPSTAFDTTDWDIDATYDQVAHFQTNSANNGGRFLDQPICPHNSYEAIIPISQNKSQLDTAIKALQPRAGTSIFLGMKWAVNLLDPTFKDHIDDLPSNVIDSTFSDRPASYGTSGQPSRTIKYIVLMTDGQNSNSEEMLPWAYDSPSEIKHWSLMNWPFFNNNRNAYVRPRSDFFAQKHTAAQADTRLANICTAAKAKDIIIFSVAMDASTHGATQMRNCASSTGHYFETSGDELVAIFEAIAAQITDLRLTQ